MYTITVQPIAEPVSTDEAAEYCRISNGISNALLDGYIMAARMLVEAAANRALMNQTIRLSMDCFPGRGAIAWRLGHEAYGDGLAERDILQSRNGVQRAIWLPLPPLVSVTSIVYVDENGTPQTLSPTAYAVDTDSEPGRVTPAFGLDWPATRQQANAVQITYQAGYPSAALVPAPLKLAIKMLAAYWYDNPNAAAGGSISEQPLAVSSLIASFAVPAVH